MDVIKIVLLISSLLTLAMANWYPIGPEPSKVDPNQKPPQFGDSSLMNLAKKVDEIHGDQTARNLCQQALTNHILQSFRNPQTPTATTPQPDIAARIGPDDYYTMIPSLNQLRTLGHITNMIGQTKNVVQKIMTAFGY